MKRIIIFLIICSIFLVSCGQKEEVVQVQEQVQDEKIVKGEEGGVSVIENGELKIENYESTNSQSSINQSQEEITEETGFLTGDIISCLGNDIEDIDSATFELLDFGYGKDKETLYYCGYLGFLGFPEVDVQTVEILGEESLQDKNFKYKLGMNGILEKEEKVIQKREDLGSGFSKDLDFVYYKDEKIEGLDPDTFKMLGYKYIKDDKSVFFLNDGKYQKSAGDASSFEVIGTRESCVQDIDYSCFAKDKNNIISNGQLLTGADVASFEVVDNLFAKDNDSVFHVGKELLGLDGASFEVVGGDFVKDVNGIYLLRPSNIYKSYIQINEADPNSFRVLESYYDDNVYAVDITNVYYYETVVQNNITRNYLGVREKTIDSDTVKVLGDGYVEDLRYIYYFHLAETKINSYKLEIDPNTVEFIDAIFVMDKDNVWMKNKDTGEHIILDVDRKSFRFLNPSYATDYNNVYYYSAINNEFRIVEGADLDTFMVSENNRYCDEKIDKTCFAMDDDYDYKYGVRVETDY